MKAELNAAGLRMDKSYGRYGMGMYEEIDKETMELLLGSLVERTLSGKQEWEGLDYKQIGRAHV